MISSSRSQPVLRLRMRGGAIERAPYEVLRLASGAEYTQSHAHEETAQP